MIKPSPSPDSDQNAIWDTVETCPHFLLSPPVAIDGCTIADQVQQCASTAGNHGQFVGCVAGLT